MVASSFSIQMQAKRMMSRKDAAVYCGLPVSRFEDFCPIEPVTFANGSRRWDIHDLDRWIDGYKGDSDCEHESLLDKLG